MSTIDKASLIQIPSGYKNGKLYSVKPNPTYGSELVTNGDFASSSNWNGINANGVTISNGTLNYSETPNGINVTQSSVVEIGKRYKVTFTISNYVKGGILFVFGAGGTTQEVSSNGTFNLYGVASINTTLYIQARGASGTTLSIDNVSVKEITNIGDFDFSRSSSATRVNSEGLIETAQVVSTTEEVINGDFASDSDWTKGSGWTISGGTANSSGLNSNLQQNSILVVGKKYEIKITVINYVSGTVEVSVGAAPRDQITANGTYTFRQVCTPNSNFYIISASFIGSIDNVSVKEVFENDVPRLDYSGGASCASLLLEGQSTNLVTYSESLSNSPIKNGTFTDNFATSPDGTQNATKITATSTDPFFYQSISFNASDYTASIYIKGIGDSIGKDFQIRLGTNIYENTIPSEWTRFVYTATMTSITTNAGIEIPEPAVVGDEVLAWGWQIEESSYATSYIPTNGSTVTRSADVCNNAGTSATFNSTEGVLFAEIAALADDLTNRKISISDGTTNNSVLIFYTNVNNAIQCKVTVGGSASMNHYFSISDITSFSKLAVKWKVNDFAIWLDGYEVHTDTSGGSFSSGTLTTVNFDRGDGGEDFYGKTKQLMVFDEALSDEELSDLTGQVNLSFNNLATFYNYTIL